MRLAAYFEEAYNSDELKTFLDLVSAGKKPTRKAERAQLLARILLSPSELKRLWQEMDDLSRKALATAYHNDGAFDADAFIARYDQLPERPKKSGWYAGPILFDAFMLRSARYGFSRFSMQILPQLMPLLGPLMPPPERFELASMANAPAIADLDGRQYALEKVETEAAGHHDLLLLLTLLHQGELKLTRSSLKLTSKSVKTFCRRFLQSRTDAGDVDPDDAIRAFGLTIFAVESGLADSSGNLTDLGQAYLTTEDPTCLLDAFVVWSEGGKFDELTRISAIKGTRARGVELTAPAERRERIVEALSWSPVNVWISIADFYRALKIWHLDFDIEDGGLERLYVGYVDRRGGYSEPWADRSTMWLLTNGLYVNAVLWEYLAAIGAIDLLYSTDPYFLPAQTYYGLDQRPVSDYDGLAYFRITPLGAYLFGQSGVYTPDWEADEALFTVEPGGTIVIRDVAGLTGAHRAQLDQIADASSTGYRLSLPKLLTILETASDLAVPRAFLERRSGAPLPDSVVRLFEQTEADSRALEIRGRMLTIKVRSMELVEQILADPTAGKIARHLEGRTLLIAENRESAFRTALRNIGFGVRK